MPLFYPTLRQAEKNSSVTENFLGINRRLRIGDGEFYDMQNLTSDDAPVLSTRKARGMPLYEGVTDPHALIIGTAVEQGVYQGIFLDGATLRIGSSVCVDLIPFGYEVVER